MKRNITSGITLSLLLLGILALAFNIQPAKSVPTTWTVDDDGGADFTEIQDAINAASPGDTIYVYNGTYNENPVVNKTLLVTGEDRSITTIVGNVMIQDNTVHFQGFTVQGDMPGSGITLFNSSNSVISNNKITSKRWAGIILQECSNSNIISNNIVMQNEYGINIGSFGSPPGNNNNTITDNVISNNTIGIEICVSSIDNKIFRNRIENNSGGGILILDAGALGNKVYHNNILYNGENRNAEDLSSNTWDDGYPSGGNYWSDHNPPDNYNGPNQDILGSDEIGDIPYIVDGENTDMYPLIYPYDYVPGPDLDNDEIVDIEDVVIAVIAFGSEPGDPKWNPFADCNQDGLIDIFDLVMIGIHFGEEW